MTVKLRVLSGHDVLRIFESHGFVQSRQKGDHVRVSRKTTFGTAHVTIPLHREVRIGTLHGIAQDFASVFGEELMRSMFYTND